MATAPKTIVKSSAKGGGGGAEEAAGGGGGGKSKKKLLVMIIAGVVVLSAAGAGAFLFLGKKKVDKAEAAKEAKEKEHAKLDPSKPPVFMPLDPFTVNLQSEMGDQFLQTTLTLQVLDQKTADLMKNYTPQIRSRLLILLSGKKASEISSTEGKQKLSEEIVALMREPFVAGGPEQEVTGVFITSFIIQ